MLKIISFGFKNKTETSVGNSEIKKGLDIAFIINFETFSC